MIYFAIIIALAATVMLLIWKPERKDENSRFDSDNFNYYKLKMILVPSLYGLGFILFIFSCFTSVSAGNIGIQSVFGKVNTSGYLTEGLHMINPFAATEQMSGRTQTYTMSAVTDEGQKKGDDALEVLTSDGLILKIEVSVPYRLVPANSAFVYQKFGTQYGESIVRPSIRSALREAFSHYAAQDAYGVKRDEAKAMSLEKLIASINDLVAKAGISGPAIDIDQVLIRNIELPGTVKQSIESKVAAQQESEKMQYVIQKEKQEAERKRVEAKGIHDFQEIVSSGISEPLLKWKGIEATEKLANSPNSKVIVIGNSKDGLPIILGNN